MIFVRMFCIIVIITSCRIATAQISPILGSSGRLLLVEDRTVVLDESKVVFDEVTSLAFTDNGEIVVVSSRNKLVLVFTASGDFLRRLGRQGMGPAEYNQPGIVRTIGNSVYVWDEMSLKLIEYSSTGEYIDEWTGFTKSIRDFRVFQDRRNIAFLNNTREQEGFLQVYDFGTDDYGDAYGSSNIEHLMLMMRGGTGFFVLNGDEILFGSSSRAVLMAANLTTGQYREISIPDDDFEVRDSGLESAADINANFDRVFKFIYANSMLMGVFETTNFYVVSIEDGKYDPEDLNPMYGIDEQPSEDERRRVKLFFYTKSLDLIDSIEIPAAVHDEIGLRMLADTGDQLVFYIQEYDEDAVDAIKKLTFLRLETMN